MAEGQGNFGNHEQHVKAGSMSSGNTGRPEEHAKAGREGAKAQPTEAKAKGGRNSHGGGRKSASE
ncbi:MAG TPA: hypothetical protein VLA88_02355 [Candidatus Saccharimonadales bacterium]|nr:hypothetical protein [Candidatus Saccharimonadales bacterium]